jgi:hypothetical protein
LHNEHLKADLIYRRYLRLSLVRIFVVSLFEAVSILLLYELLGSRTCSSACLFSLLAFYILLFIYTELNILKHFVYKYNLLKVFAEKICNNNVAFNKRLDVYLCNINKKMYCLSLNYLNLYIIMAENIKTKTSVIGKVVDFTCFRLISAIKLKEGLRGVKVFVGEGEVPSLTDEKHMDLVRGKFVEIDIRGKEISSLPLLVRSIESII